MRLDGKRIVVTGATGIAGAAARRFSSEGGRVFVASIDPDECEQLAGEVDLAGWAALDLSEEPSAVDALTRAASSLGGIDGLFAVAGGSGRKYGDGPAHEVTLKAWEATLGLNLTTSFLAGREAVRLMLDSGEGGSIALVSSVLAMHPVADLFSTHAYAAAKGAQISLAMAMAARYASDQIRVNVIAPGLVRTPMSERAAGDEQTVDFARRKQPLAGGFLETEDVAAAATFLLSDDARHITGQVLAVDGGWGVSEAGT